MKKFFGLESRPGSSRSSFHSTIYRSGYTQLQKTTVCLFVFASAVLSARTNLAQAPSVPSHLGPFSLQERLANPLREPFNIASRPTPTLVDLDRDGDYDVVLADFDGGNGFHYLQNDGTPTAPAFSRKLYYANPFEYGVFDDGAVTTFTDSDGDGDLDMLFGVLDGTFRFYRRETSTTHPFALQDSPWDPATKTGNPLYSFDFGDYAAPVFHDMDNDGDADIIVGCSYLPNNKSMYYLLNDGSFNFTVSPLTGINPNQAEVTPAFIDVNADGLEDIITGDATGFLHYFKRTGVTSFTEMTGADNPFSSFNKGQYSSPTTADLDGDGDKDLVVGAVNPIDDLFYLENKGSGVFEEKTSFDNPFGGAAVISDSSPLFIDVDNDGDDDAVIGSSDNQDPYLRYFKKANGKFTEVLSNNPFSGYTMPNKFVPCFIDIDGDGDRDIVGSADNSDMNYIEYLKNENGTFIRQDVAGGPFESIYVGEGRAEFADIDGDNDFDLFFSEQTQVMWDFVTSIRFFRNVGTSTNPLFQEITGPENPLGQVHEQYELLPRLLDIDHDGDLDALIGEGGNTVEWSDGNEFHYYENTGTKTAPVFKYRGNLIDQGDNATSPAPSFTDFDNDGDLDIFQGSIGGEIYYYKNDNPAAIIAINSTALNYAPGTPAFIDANLTLSDADQDSIVFASVAIENYASGQDVLEFTSHQGITGSFNAATGVLTFNGKAPIADYESILRSATFASQEPVNGRKRISALATTSKTITVVVRDADGTNSTAAVRAVNIVSANAPVFTDGSMTLLVRGLKDLSLSSLISDLNSDADLATLSITQQPASGATASINAGILHVDYSSVAFWGSETITLSVCDQTGLCDQSTITVTVTNTAPSFADQSLTVKANNQIIYDLKPLMTDADNNIVVSTTRVVTSPASGLVASVDANAMLTLNYQNVIFAGDETIQLEVCDAGNVCAQNTINVHVSNTAPVFNTTTVTLPFAGSKSVDLLPLISDSEGNYDLSTLTITQPLNSNASAVITSSNLQLNYSAVTFSGSEQIGLRICDRIGSCAETFITVQVTNLAPAIVPEPVQTNQGSTKTLNLLAITTDPDGNLDPTTFQIVQNPVSGATAVIEVVSDTEVELSIDYSQVSFSGVDQLVIRACDKAGACTENTIAIQVDSSIEIYNAVAPNSPGNNKFFRILNLPTDNKVSIFNRWGDVVYQVEGYNNESVRFEGRSTHDVALTSGTYFYKVEYHDQSNSLKTLTGYLSLKQ